MRRVRRVFLVFFGFLEDLPIVHMSLEPIVVIQQRKIHLDELQFSYLISNIKTGFILGDQVNLNICLSSVILIAAYYF